MRTTLRVMLPALLMIAASFSAAEAQPRPFKVFISADLEGIAGVVTPEQLGPTGFEYQRAREWMTAEVLAAIAGAREAGATEIVVADSHGNGQNLLMDRLPADIMLIRAWPGPLGMMEGIDSTFHAAIFIGYHASTDNPRGVRTHTFSSANYAGVRLNGVVVPEGGVNAAIAGRFGVPVVLVTGDDVTVAEMKGLIPDIEGAIVKRAISFHSAATMTPEAAQALIRQRTREALGRRAAIRPYVLRAPIQLDLTFKNYRPAEMLTYLTGVERRDAHTIRYSAPDMVAMSRFLQFVANYEPGLSP